jgi:hypothetical protein
VAGVCREIGLAKYPDEQAVGSQQQVSIGTATMATVLNGLGFSNRQLYLVPQFFANKPVARLLGPGVTAEQLNDDRLGRTPVWLTQSGDVPVPLRPLDGSSADMRSLAAVARA